MQTDGCRACEEQDLAEHDEDLRWGAWLFAIGTALLALILAFFVVWHYGPTLLWPSWLRTMRLHMQATTYAEWFLAATAGTLVYLLRNIARHRTEEHRFHRFAGWYVATLITGPIVALVVMWLLTNLTLVVTPSELPGSTVMTTNTKTQSTVTSGGPGGSSVVSSTVTTAVVGAPGKTGAVVVEPSSDSSAPVAGGIVLDIGKLALEAQLGVAFILGYFGRTTTKQLEIITRKLLPTAYDLAETTEFDVKPARATVVAGGSVQFKPSRSIEVSWSASGGDIGSETGAFVAPALDAAAFSAKGGTILGMVKAHPKGVPYVYKSAVVEIVPFEIKGTGAVVAGEEALFATVPAIKDIRWEASVPAMIDKHTGLLKTTPSDKGKTIVVTAGSATWHHFASRLVRIT